MVDCDLMIKNVEKRRVKWFIWKNMLELLKISIKESLKKI
jgi:hypothetical protein